MALDSHAYAQLTNFVIGWDRLPRRLLLGQTLLQRCEGVVWRVPSIY